MATVGCVGIVVTDMLCGPIHELPRPGQLLTVEDIPAKVGGCAANVAIGLSKQGVTADVVGCLGRDNAAEVPLTALRKCGVGCDGIVYSDRLPTSKTVILLVEGEDRRYIHAFGANSALTIGHIRRDWVEGLKVFYLGGLFVLPGIVTGELYDLLSFCRRAGIATVVDVVVPQPFEHWHVLRQLLPQIDYFLPNDDEARLFTGKSDPLDQIAMLQGAGAHTVILKCGRKGAVAARGRARWRCGIYAMQVVDPSGSGDAFAAGVITGILGGWEMPRLLRYASALGASAVRAVGTTDGVFLAQEAEAFVADHRLEVEEWFAS